MSSRFGFDHSFAVLAVFAAGLLASCGDDHPSSGANTGTISVQLVAHTASATYHLRNATFVIVGPGPAPTTTTTVTPENTNRDVPSVDVQLAPGHYTVTLLDGWTLSRGGGDAGAEVQIAATLLSPNPASFDVTAGTTTFVPFRFATDGSVVATGPTGTVEVGTEVNELHGLALLAGDHAQSGSTDGVGAAARFDTPTTLVSDGLGNLYVNDSHNLTIRKLVVATGQVTTIAGSPGQSGYTDGVGSAARFVFPYGMALDGKGNLYISDQFHLRRLVIATGQVLDLEITDDPEGTPLSISAALAVDGTGAPLVVEAVPMATTLPLRRVDLENLSARSITVVPPSVDAMTAVQRPMDARGALPLLDIYLSEGAQTKIECFRFVTDASGVLADAGPNDFQSVAGKDGNPGTADGHGASARFARPNAIAADGAGNLFVADPPNGTIRKLTIDRSQIAGDLTTVVGQAGVSGGPTPGPLPAVLGRPVGVAVLPNGALAIADGNAIYIARF